MPVTPTYPGIYIQEAASASHTIISAPTNIAVFIGYTHPLKTKPESFGVPFEIFSFTDYQRQFGSFVRSAAFTNAYDGATPTPLPGAFGDMAQAVSQFFLNGGTHAFVVSVNQPSSKNTASALGKLVPQPLPPFNFPLSPPHSPISGAPAQSIDIGGVVFTQLEVTDEIFVMSVVVTPAVPTSPVAYGLADIIITYGPGLQDRETPAFGPGRQDERMAIAIERGQRRRIERRARTDRRSVEAKCSDRALQGKAGQIGVVGMKQKFDFLVGREGRAEAARQASDPLALFPFSNAQESERAFGRPRRRSEQVGVDAFGHDMDPVLRKAVGQQHFASPARGHPDLVKAQQCCAMMGCDARGFPGEVGDAVAPRDLLRAVERPRADRNIGGGVWRGNGDVATRQVFGPVIVVPGDGLDRMLSRQRDGKAPAMGSPSARRIEKAIDVDAHGVTLGYLPVVEKGGGWMGREDQLWRKGSAGQPVQGEPLSHENFIGRHF